MSRNDRPSHRTFGRLKLERLKARETPAVVTYTVNTEADAPDNNLTDGVPMCGVNVRRLGVVPLVSLRSVIEQMNASGNGTDTYRIEFDLSHAAGMTIALGSQLPGIANRHYQIDGANRAVTLTRDPNAQPTDFYRFFSVAATGNLEVIGLKLTGGDNRGNLGGAIYNAAGGTLDLENCYFASNIAHDGGAITNQGNMTINTQAGQPKTEFLGNTSENFGGAVYCGGLGVVPVTDIGGAIFTDNWAGSNANGRQGNHKGGAIAMNVAGRLSVSGCTFTVNRAEEGGAIYADGPFAAQPTLTITDSTFQNNTAITPNSAKGGAIYVGGLSARFTGCAFPANQSDDEGGAIYQIQGALVLDTCTFTNNSAAGVRGSHDVANEVGPGNPTTVFLITTTANVVVF